MNLTLTNPWRPGLGLEGLPQTEAARGTCPQEEPGTALAGEQYAENTRYLPVRGTVSAQRNGLKAVRGEGDHSLTTDPHSPRAWLFFSQTGKGPGDSRIFQARQSIL